jgi:hypothetical protein
MDTIVKGMTHKEMLAIMMDAGIFCSPEKFARVLVDAQSRVEFPSCACSNDKWEDDIRSYGIVAACEWFGHAHDSDFTAETFRVLGDKGNRK